MIHLLVKPGMGGSSDWRYGCPAICMTGKASLPVCFFIVVYFISYVCFEIIWYHPDGIRPGNKNELKK